MAVVVEKALGWKLLASSKDLQSFLDGELVGLIESVSVFMENTNALRSAWEDGLVLFTDALESQRKANEKLQKQFDLLRVEKAIQRFERK